MTPQEIMDATSLKVGALGAAFYFDPATLAVGKEAGLDGMRFYLIGRAGVLGDVESEVVTSAFAYFNGDLVAKLWNTAKEKIAPRAAADLYNEAAANFGRARLADVEGLEGFCAAAEKLVAASPLGGLALFAGWKAQPLADDMPARAMQLLALMREQRGSAHIAAIIATGLRPEIAHVMRRPDMIAGFGWDPAPETTDADAALAALAEDYTDTALRPTFAVLSDDEAAAYIGGVNAIEAALAT